MQLKETKIPFRLTDLDISCLELLPPDMWPKHLQGMQPRTYLGSVEDLFPQYKIIHIETRDKIKRMGD